MVGSEDARLLGSSLIACSGSPCDGASWTLDALLDALIVLFDECSGSSLRRERSIADFIDRARPYVDRVRELRPSKRHFELVKTIGRGAFGDVVLAKCSGEYSSRLAAGAYAVKILNKGEMLKRADTACFREERDLLIRGDGDWITRMHCAFQDTDNLYLVLDYYPGGDLLTLLSKFDDSFPEPMARFYCAEIGIAIQCVHSLGYVHRDVKPDNVLLDCSGHIRLGDFGSAVRMYPVGNTAQQGVAVGTPDYISPEILQAMESGKGVYGTECDWWSLGCTLWEMLFGLPPFYATSLVETYGNIMRHVQKRLELAFPSEVTEPCRDLIGRLLSPADCRIVGLDELRGHPFFANVSFDDIRAQVPPFVPQVLGSLDTSNFDLDVIEQRRALGGGVGKQATAQTAQAGHSALSGAHLPFIGFSYSGSMATVECEPSRTSVGVQAEGEGALLDETRQMQRSLLASLEGEQRIRGYFRRVTHEMSRSVNEMQSQLLVSALVRQQICNDGPATAESQRPREPCGKWQQGRNAKALHMQLQEMEALLKREQEQKVLLQCELRLVKEDNVVKSEQIECLSDEKDRLQRQVAIALDSGSPADVCFDRQTSDHVHKFIDTSLALNEPEVCVICRTLLRDPRATAVCLYCDKLSHFPKCENGQRDTVTLRGMVSFSFPSRWNADRFHCVLTKRRFVIFAQGNATEMYRVYDRRCIRFVGEHFLGSGRGGTFRGSAGGFQSKSAWRQSSSVRASGTSATVDYTQSPLVYTDSSQHMFSVLLSASVEQRGPIAADNGLLCLNCVVESKEQKQRWVKLMSPPVQDSATADLSGSAPAQSEFKAWRLTLCRWKCLRCALVLSPSEVWIGTDDNLQVLTPPTEFRNSSTCSVPRRMAQRRTFQLDRISDDLVLVISGRSRSARALLRRPNSPLEAIELCKLAKNVTQFALSPHKLYLVMRFKALLIFDRPLLIEQIRKIGPVESGSSIAPSLTVDLTALPSHTIRCLDVLESSTGECRIVAGHDNAFSWYEIEQGRLDTSRKELCTIAGEPLGSVLLDNTVFLISTTHGYTDATCGPLKWPSVASSYAHRHLTLFICCPTSGIHIYRLSGGPDSTVHWSQTLSLLNPVPLNMDGSLMLCHNPVSFHVPSGQHAGSKHKAQDQQRVQIVDLKPPVGGGQLTIVHLSTEQGICLDVQPVAGPAISLPSDFRHLTHIGKGVGQSIVRNIESSHGGDGDSESNSSKKAIPGQADGLFKCASLASTTDSAGSRKATDACDGGVCDKQSVRSCPLSGSFACVTPAERRRNQASLALAEQTICLLQGQTLQDDTKTDSISVLSHYSG